MKTPILKLSLILCLLFLGVKNVQAGTTINDITTITSGNIYQGQQNIAVAGISVQTNNNTTDNLTGATFTINGSLTGALANAQLVTSTSTFNPQNFTVVANAPSNQTASTITFSGFTSINIRNTTVYFYLIVDYTGATTNTTYTFKPATYNTGNGNNNVPTPATNTFTLKAPLLTLATDNTGLNATNLTTSQNGIAVYGMSASSDGTSTFNGLTFSITSNPAGNISPNYSSVTLYKSNSTTSSSFASAAVLTTGATGVISGTTVTFNSIPTQTIADGATAYYFLVVNYAQPPTTTYQTSFNTPTFSGLNGTITGTAPGQTYTLNPPVITITATSLGAGGANPTNGLAASPVTTTLTNQAIYGLQLTGGGTGPNKTITALTFNPVAAQNTNYYFASMSLYASTTSSASGIIQPALKTIATTADGNPFTFTGLNINVSSTSTLYYFVVVNYTGVDAASTFQLDFASATGATVTNGTVTGFNYVLPSITVTATSLGAGGTNPANGLTANPIVTAQNAQAIYGLQLTGTGSGPAKTITSITFDPNSTTPVANNNNFFTGMSLYASSTNSATGIIQPALATVAANGNTNNMSFTGLNIPVAGGATVYYFVLINYNGVTTPSNLQLNFSSAATATTTVATAATANKGFNYAYKNPTLTITTNVANTIPAAINHDLVKQAVFSFYTLATTGTPSISGFTFNYTGSNIATTFTNIGLYSSTSATWTTTTAPGVTAVVPSITLTNNAATISASGLNEPTSTTRLYYFLVADLTDQITNNATLTARFSLGNAGVDPTANNATVTGGTLTGTAYTISSPVIIDNPTFSALATNPLNASASNIAILGFSVQTFQAESFTTFTLKTATGTGFANISPYFTGTPVLYSTASLTATGTPVSGASCTVNTNAITVNVAENFPAGTTTRYYYLVFPNYIAPATTPANATFELDCTNAITAAHTFTNGAPATGPAYNLGPGTFDWVGGSGTTAASKSDWTIPGNWAINGVTAGSYPGQNGATADIVRIGVGTSFTSQPALSSTSATIASLTFGYLGPQSTYQTSPNRLIKDDIILTVNSPYTLTVTGNIIQNHDASAPSSNFNFSVTTFAGSGTIICNGNLAVGDVATQPAFTVAVVTEVASQINQLTIKSNIILTTNGNGNITPTGNRGICYAYFSLEKGTTTVLKQIKFAINNNPVSSLFDNYNPGITAYQGYGLFSADKLANSISILELQNATPIVPADGFYVHFNYGGNNGTVLYNDPTPGESQTVYTANEPSATNTQTYINNTGTSSYYNVTFSGASTKIVDANSTLGTTPQGLTIANDWTTDGGLVDLTKDPTVIIGGDWTNTTTIKHDAGAITVGGMFSNNVSGDASGTLTCGAGPITFKGGYTNNGIFTANPTGLINFSPVATETITDNSSAGTIFNNVNFTSGATTINAGASNKGNIAVSNVGKLKMSGSANLIAGTTTAGGVAYLTLMSDGASTATVYTPGGTSISGNVNVQRWVTGGAGYRGYRLFSSPVNINQSVTGTGNLALGYLGLNAKFAGTTYNGAFTEGPGSGFVFNGSSNPIIYLYDETRITNNTSFTAGKNIGVYSITGNTVTTLTSNVQTPNVNVPIGNSYLLYYVGDNSSINVATSRIPESTAVTATGYLNQGPVTVKFWNTQNTAIPYDVNGGNLPGLNQVGNPYASTISLTQLYNDNVAAGSNISPQFWELDATTGISGTYIATNALSGATSTTKSSNYIVSGQGFLVQALGTGATLTFREGEKVDYPPITSGATSGGALLMDIPSSASTHDIAAKSFAQNNTTAPVSTVNPALLTGLHLQLSKDSTAYTQTGIYYSSKWTDSYNPKDDAMDLDGGNKVFLSSYSTDGKRLSINQLGDYSKGKRVRLYAGANSSGLFSISLADLANVDTTAYNVFLVDKKMNDSLDMAKYKTYSFNINNSDTTTYGAYRFVLAIERKSVLPYALISFSGQKVNNGVQLVWKTLNEGTYTGFTLQKLSGISNYTSIYNTQGTASGIYAYVDQHPTNGNNTYRLQQTDIDGKVTYSSPVTINYNARAPKGDLSIYPNPSKTIINISLNTVSAPGTQNYIADIYNTSGTIVDHKTINSSTWTQDITSYKLGVYVIEIKTDTGYLIGQSKFVKVN